MAIFQSNTLTIVDQTDNRKIEVYIKSNMPTAQIFNQNTGAYSPDWSSGLELTADVYLDSREIESYEKVSFQWSVDDGSSITQVATSRTYRTTNNTLASKPILTYICVASYQNISATSKITFARTDTGKNGADGTSVNIKGTATSITAIPETDYYTITYEGSDISNAELNDSYMYNGDLYTCVNSRDGIDYFINVGRIQGPAGKDAKSIILTGSAQVFKINKANVYTPSTISVTATSINTTITEWTYSVNGGQTFLSTVPTGVTRNGNVVTVAGSTLASNSIVIKASDGAVSDVFTIYKAFDGTDGRPGNPGAPASLAFLTNENISFAANASGQVPLTTLTTNVVAYTGTTKVTPVIGTVTGLPSGMTLSTPTTVLNEVLLTFNIANGSTLGSNSSTGGTITIPITSPVSTNLKLNWSKINTGASGVGIKSTTVSYGVSDAPSTQPTEWQSTIPAVAEGNYLWTRTIVDYTDDNVPDTVTYIYAKQGEKGTIGDPGNSVTVSSIQYQEGASATTAPTGTWSNAVVAAADGKYLWTKTTFSDSKIAYGVAKQGNTGMPASLVDVTPSALYFKSTAGSTGTFTPQYIYLYPRFQNAIYSNWQYSRDGGSTWSSATGANGLSIGTYNSVANSLRVDRSSTLYTNDITSISFRCNSTTINVYDTVSIAKIYDVVDLQIGGTNLLMGTKDFSIDTSRLNGWYNPTGYDITTDEDGFAVAIKEGVDFTTSAHRGIYSSVIKVIQDDKFTASFWMKIADTALWDNQVPIILELYDASLVRVAWHDCQLSELSTTPSILQNNIWTYCTLPFTIKNPFFNFIENKAFSDVVYFGIRLDLAKNGKIYFKKAKVERGNKATDWSPAPEDLIEEAANINVMLSNEAHFFEASPGGVPKESSIVLDVVGYKGSVRSATTVGTITGMPSSGMTVTVSNNGTTNTKLTIAITPALTSDVADYGILTIPITVNGHTLNKVFSWTKAKAGDVGLPGSDAITFQVYSNNGYALSASVPTIVLQTFAYIGDVEIKAGATYQWYRHNGTDWVTISGATNDYFNVSRDDVSFSNNYMCKMYFSNTEYVGVVTIEDKNDEHRVFASKPSNYFSGDLWVVGNDYIPSGFAVGSMLRAAHTNTAYADSDWELATRYDKEIDDVKASMGEYAPYFALNKTEGLRVGDATINNNILSVDHIETTTINTKEVQIESPLTVSGRYSGSTMLQAPIINLGNFSFVVESNGSLSIIVNT
jgi:hypothetical protein